MLVEEGLYYFERVGDAGDRKYVQAIRDHIRRLSNAGGVVVTQEMVERCHKVRMRALFAGATEVESMRAALCAALGVER